MNKCELADKILEGNNIVFLTGAGVSTLSGIPDYRSMDGLYSRKDNPEYLLSHDCLNNEPDKFYDFVKNLYHLEAKANIIHNVIVKMEDSKNVTVITQNIDELHEKAGSDNLLEFHGSLYDLYCSECHQKIEVEDYLKSYIHVRDEGIIRPNVVLYGEMLDERVINGSIAALQTADTVVLVGTTFKVYPFASLLEFVNARAKVILINKEDVYNSRVDYKYIGNAKDVFEELEKII